MPNKKDKKDKVQSSITETSNTETQTTQETQKPVVHVAHSMADINAAFASMDEKTRAELKALQVPASTLAGTAGKYRTADGKGVTDKREEAKLSINKKPIPVFTRQRPAVIVNGVAISATHADETEQLRGRYAGGWGQQVIAACLKRAQELKRNLTQKERDVVLNKIGVVPKAWLPRYNKDATTPASQYARHIAVQDEFRVGMLN